LRSSLQENVTVSGSVSVSELPNEEVIEATLDGEEGELCIPQVVDVAVENDVQHSASVDRVRLLGKIEGDVQVCLRPPCLAIGGAVGTALTSPPTGGSLRPVLENLRQVASSHAPYSPSISAEKLRGESVELIALGSAAMPSSAESLVQVTSLVESTNVSITAATLTHGGQPGAKVEGAGSPLVKLHKVLADKCRITAGAIASPSSTDDTSSGADGTAQQQRKPLVRVGSAYAKELLLRVAAIGLTPTRSASSAAAHAPLPPLVHFDQLHGHLDASVAEGASISEEAASFGPLIHIDNISGSVNIVAKVSPMSDISSAPPAAPTAVHLRSPLIRLHFDEPSQTQDSSVMLLLPSAALLAALKDGSKLPPLIEVTALARDAPSPSGSLQVEVVTAAYLAAKSPDRTGPIVAMDAYGRDVSLRTDKASPQAGEDQQLERLRTTFELPLSPASQGSGDLSAGSALSISGKIGTGASSTQGTFYSPSASPSSNVGALPTQVQQPRRLRIELVLTGDSDDRKKETTGANKRQQTLSAPLPFPLISVEAVSWMDKVKRSMQKNKTLEQGATRLK
jgi:hypothetical protein